MTRFDIPLPSHALRFLADDAFRVAGGAVRALAREFGLGSNAAAFADVGHALMILRRLTKLLRYAMVLLAAYLPVTAVGPKSVRKRARRSPQGERDAPRRIVFSVGRALPFGHRDADAPRAPQPAQFANAERNGLRCVQRHLSAITQALREPMPLIRRLARRMRTTSMFILWRPPKRPPEDREHWDELVNTWREADFTLGRVRRGEMDSS